MIKNKRLLLKSRPFGLPKETDFALVEEDLPALADGSFLVRNHYCSLDPAIRGWLDDAPSYFPPIALGDPIRASTIGQVVQSRAGGFTEGDWVVGLNAIEEYSVAVPGPFISLADMSAVSKPTHYLSIFGAVGLTAYFGLLEVGKPRAGETVLVSGAAGAVGSLVGQIARIQGCRTVGIAGGAEKCARLITDYAYDAAIDYRGKSLEQLTQKIRSACPSGVDVYFDNVGGIVLDAALACISDNARIALCGMISGYNATSPQPGPTNIWNLIAKTARMEGFLIKDYFSRFQEGAVHMGQWLAEGKLVFHEHIEQGIDNAVPAFLMLFSGQNKGKLILQIGDQ
jgi:NADPH-dependent curcumin reductase CurA